MPGAIMVIDQPTGAGPGSPGVARDDLWQDQQVDLSVATSGNTSFAWTFLSKPAGSGSELSTPTSPTCDFTPDLVGTYRIQLITNGGGPGNVQTLIARVRYDSVGALANRGWAYPAVGEQDGENNYIGNYRSWSEIIEFIFEDIRLHAFGGGGGGGVDIYDEDALVLALAEKINFTGAGVTAAVDGIDPTKVNVTIPGGGGGNNLTDTLTSSIPTTVGLPMSLVAGNLVAADAEAGQPQMVYGLATTVSPAGPVEVVTSGVCSYGPGGLTPGQELYLAVGGGISSSPPGTGVPNRRIVSLGIARTANTILVRIQDVAIT